MPKNPDLRSIDLAVAGLAAFIPPAGAKEIPNPDHESSAAYRWLEVVLEACARDVDRIGPRPAIGSRQMAIPVTASVVEKSEAVEVSPR